MRSAILNYIGGGTHDSWVIFEAPNDSMATERQGEDGGTMEVAVPGVALSEERMRRRRSGGGVSYF